MSIVKMLVVMTVIGSAAWCKAAINEMYFTSTPGSWVGLGQTIDATPAGGWSFGISRYYNQGAYTNAVTISLSKGTSNWSLDLVGPNYTLPTVGNYDPATRWPFQNTGVAGFDFSGNGHGDNILTGHFNVLQADYDINGTPTAFAVDFLQYDEGVSTNWVSGSMRYNSSIPVPEPAAAALALLAFPVLARRRR